MSPDVVGINFLIAFGDSSLAGFLSGYALKKALLHFQGSILLKLNMID
jgi:hypothetical protein